MSSITQVRHLTRPAAAPLCLWWQEVALTQSPTLREALL